MLESEGRKTKELIIVIDDPISSLDSRSLNFACSLIISRLSESAQIFVLTHNQNCLNEFRKPWKSKARAEGDKEPTAALLFLDVSMPVGSQRISNIIELPRLLREYDSEYHYLCHHVLQFAAAQAEYDYAYMMPNVLRRVLELFLAFRCPGSSGLPSKIAQLCKAHSALDYDRIIALERLSQMESHSDNLDDLISFSSMTIEETKDATNALLTLMQKVDPEHLKGLRRICS
jgi:wobble nucleotide-excising tRNase